MFVYLSWDEGFIYKSNIISIYIVNNIPSIITDISVFPNKRSNQVGYQTLFANRHRKRADFKILLFPVSKHHFIYCIPFFFWQIVVNSNIFRLFAIKIVYFYCYHSRKYNNKPSKRAILATNSTTFGFKRLKTTKYRSYQS